MVRHVESRLVLEVSAPTHLALAMAIAYSAPAQIEEILEIESDGTPMLPRELHAPVGGRIHMLDVGPALVTVHYRARVEGRAAPAPVEPIDRLRYLRPSRYAESDRLAAVARAEFVGVDAARSLLDAISSWAGSRLDHVPGDSGLSDGAVETLLARRGGSRDYAHLVTALLRARGVPARLVSVYAPGMQPMTLHAVVEAVVDDEWRVVDATLLAPRASLLRVATGRDAADTEFLSSFGGTVELRDTSVSAWTDGQLPADDITELISLG